MIRILTIAWDGLARLVGIEPDLVSTVAATDATLKMVGRWKYGNDVVLIVENQADRVEFLRPANETWRAEISSALIVDESVRFTTVLSVRIGQRFRNSACMRDGRKTRSS